MRKLISNKDGFTLIEVMIVLAILLIIARYVFAHELFEFENNMWRTLGVPPEIPRIFLGVCVIAYVLWRAVKERKEKKRSKLLN